MPTDSRAARSGALRRRAGTVPVLFVTWLVWLVATPALAVVAVAIDRGRRAPGSPSLRLVAFVAAYLTYEVVGVSAAAWLWLTWPVHRVGWAARNRRLQQWWTGGLVRAAGPILGLRLEVDLDEAGDVDVTGPAIVLSRHVSIVDSLLPAQLLGVERGRHLRYVLTKGLRLDPCLDIVGHRLPNHFLDRGAADSSADLAALGCLGRDLGPEDVVVIFPEGGLATDERRRRARERLEASGSPRALVVGDLRWLLPPRPAGTLALLEAAPDADVIVFAHHGFEPLGSLGRLWRVLPLTEPVRVRLVRHPRSTVPDDAAGQVRWLDEQWAAMDRWLVDADDASARPAAALAVV